MGQRRDRLPREIGYFSLVCMTATEINIVWRLHSLNAKQVCFKKILFLCYRGNDNIYKIKSANSKKKKKIEFPISSNVTMSTRESGGSCRVLSLQASLLDFLFLLLRKKTRTKTKQQQQKPVWLVHYGYYIKLLGEKKYSLSLWKKSHDICTRPW